MLNFDSFSLMGVFSKSMAPTIFFIVLSLLLIPTTTHLQSNQEGFISVVISNKGLDFAKNLLIDKAVSSIIPLQLPDIEKSVRIPLVGKVYIVLSNITIYSVNIGSSYVETGEKGIVLVASDATANLSMNWKYTYSTWLVPIAIRDSGGASVKIEGMDVGLTVAIKEQEGTLKLSVLNCGCYVKDISIKVDGGASWLYKGVVNAFQGKIESAVEGTISKKIREGIIKLDSLLQSLPKQRQLNSVAAMNITFVDDPVLSDSSIEFELNGLFTATNDSLASYHYNKKAQASVFCNGPAKMVVISLHENVFYSAALVYFRANYMHWIVDKIPDQSILNTAEWRYIIPQLYKQYPDDDMTINISVTSPPFIKVVKTDIDATICTDVTINVLDAGEVIPVACVSLVISTSCSAEILRNNNLAGTVVLKTFTMSLNWSKIGDLHMHLLQPVLSIVLKTVILPFVNLHLMKGFPLPLPHSCTLQNAEILCTDSIVKVCSDIAFTAQNHLS